MSAGIDHSRRNKQPRALLPEERERLEEFLDSISYSARYVDDERLCEDFSVTISRYNDDEYEYRHVQLPKQMLKAIPKDYFDSANNTLKLLWEEEWRGLGITQVGSS